MLPVDKVREIYYSIDEFSQIFDQSIKNSSIDTNKWNRNNPSKLSECDVSAILVLFHPGGYKCLKYFYLQHVCLHMKGSMTANNRIILRKRALIESVNDELKTSAKLGKPDADALLISSLILSEDLRHIHPFLKDLPLMLNLKQMLKCFTFFSLYSLISSSRYLLFCSYCKFRFIRFMLPSFFNESWPRLFR